MIGQNPKAEVAPFFVDGNRDKEISFEDRDRHKWMGESRVKLRAKKQNRDFQDSSEVIRYIETVAKITGGKQKESWTRRTYAFKSKLSIKPR